MEYFGEVLRTVVSGRCPSVFVRLLVASLPPNCHRTRPKDAKTRLPEPGSHAPFLAFGSGEGGIRTPGTLQRMLVREGPAVREHRRFRVRFLPAGHDQSVSISIVEHRGSVAWPG